MKPTIVENAVQVYYYSKPELNREYLKIDVPNGWDDVKKLTKRVLNYNDRLFTFTGWNSDRNECYFVRPIDADDKSRIAYIQRK